jgi:hypothetical protein
VVEVTREGLRRRARPGAIILFLSRKRKKRGLKYDFHVGINTHCQKFGGEEIKE